MKDIIPDCLYQIESDGLTKQSRNTINFSFMLFWDS